MKIISWNINGIRAIMKKDFIGFLNKENPDVLAVQEIKIADNKKELANFDFPNYEEFWHSAQRPGYSGTLFLYRKGLKVKDKIKIIVRDYPIISEDSADLAMGAWCAGEQGKYWPMYYKLFELQGTFSVSNLSLVAKEAGVTDINKFSDCLYNQKYLNNIKKDFSDGQYLEITGTPNWYINGIKISSGYISFDNWATLLDKILK